MIHTKFCLSQGCKWIYPPTFWQNKKAKAAAALCRITACITIPPPPFRRPLKPLIYNYWKYSLKYSLLTSNLVNRSGVSQSEKNGNPDEVLHDPFLVKYKTYLMLLVQNTICFIPKYSWLELGENFREHKAKRLDFIWQERWLMDTPQIEIIWGF